MKLLDTLELPFNCDAVECFLDESTDVHYLACGMYELGVNGSRVGGIHLFDVSHASFQTIKSVETPGIFDMKWKNRLLAAASSQGSLLFFDHHLEPMGCIPQDDTGFCLSVDWLTSNLLVSSSSNGNISCADLHTQTILHTFPAHCYPHDKTLPAEIWTIASQTEGVLVASGADEGALKLWDVRSPTSPALTSANKSAHEDCGICSVLFSKEEDITLLSGGYDGKLRRWDIRNLKKPLTTSVQSHGGGIWRIKEGNRHILTACMRGGFQLVGKEEFTLVSKYTEEEPQWEALAYGVDWISPFMGAGCSFYDRKLRLFALE